MWFFALFFCLPGLMLAEKQFLTGQGARLIIGQENFTAMDPGEPVTEEDEDGNTAVTGYQPREGLLGGAGGVAYANDTLFVADGNRLNATPQNNRVLIYQNVTDQLPAPTDELIQTDSSGARLRCPVCVGMPDVVLGQPTMTEVEEVKLPPTSQSLRTAVGVASDGMRLAVADTDNNRVLIWNTIPTTNAQPADVVVGQPDFESTATPGFNPTANALRGPQGVWLQDGKLFVADTGYNRVLIWNQVPTSNGTDADIVLGQESFTSFVQPDLTKDELEPTSTKMLTPVSVTSDGQRLYVTDLGHNRVLIWNQIPATSVTPADIVVGQADMETAIANDVEALCEPIDQEEGDEDGDGEENEFLYPPRCAATLDFPRFALSDGQQLFIADGGNDRILVYEEVPTTNGAAADVVIGQITDQANNTSDSAFPNDIASAGVVRTATSLAWDGLNLYAADPFNRRVLVFTMAENRVLYSGVRNAASFDVRAIGRVLVTGGVLEEEEDDIDDDDVIRVRVAKDSDAMEAEEYAEYSFKIEDGDPETIISDIVWALTNEINNSNDGAGDPYVFATPNLPFQSIILTSKEGGEAGNEIAYAVVAEIDGVSISAEAESTNLKGGEEASKIAPGSVVMIVGNDLSTGTESAPENPEVLPTELAGTQVYFDGIRAPLYFVSPTQINAQMPVEVYDAQGASAYVRTLESDGSVTASNAIPVPIVQFNPGIFAEDGTDPRRALAYHSSSYATGVVSIDGNVTEGDVLAIYINDREYTYTVSAEDEEATIIDPGDDLESDEDDTRDQELGRERLMAAMIEALNQDPEIVASPSGQFTRIRIRARVKGPRGNGIEIRTDTWTAEDPDGGDADIILTATTNALCCANEAMAPITEANPAIPGETIIVYATGLGLVQPDEARDEQKTGEAYRGPELNEAIEFVSSLAGGRTANVLFSGLEPGLIGVYRVDLQLNQSIPTNPLTAVTIAQGFQVSNIVTVPVFNPDPASGE